MTTAYTGNVLLGAGFDGDIHITANNQTIVDPILGAGHNIVNNGVLTRDINPSSLEIDPGCTLQTGNFDRGHGHGPVAGHDHRRQ